MGASEMLLGEPPHVAVGVVVVSVKYLQDG